MRRLKTMDDIPLDGKVVLVRVDFNVGIGADGVVDEYEDYRIESAVPTIEELMQRRCKVVLLTHLGRPAENQKDLSLMPVRSRLSEILNEDIRLLNHLYGEEVSTVLTAMSAGEAVMLPNVRLDEREAAGSDRLAESLAGVGEVYINEAFSVSHRSHTSVALVPRLLPAAAGRHCVTEYNVLSELRRNPRKPYVAIVSGAKVSTKIKLLEQLLDQVDHLCLGGILANAFLVALRKCAPGQHCTYEDLKAAEDLWQRSSDKIELPEDVVVGPVVGTQGATTVSVSEIPSDVGGIWDVGPYTVKKYLEFCRNAGTVLWNGPLGKVEEVAYANGTRDLAAGLADMQAFRVVGGGETVTALERLRLTRHYDYVSVGGGALVTLLEGSVMPGLEPLFVD